MSDENNKNNWLKQLLPIVGVILSVLAFFSDGFPVWVTAAAVTVGGLLVLAWFFSEVGWIGKAIKFRWFKSKLTKDQAVRLSILLDDIDKLMSYSYTNSPFYVWHNYSNKYPSSIKFNISYFSTVHSWLEDLNVKFNDPKVNNMILLNSLSNAISETTRFAECIERDLEEFIRKGELTDQEKNRLTKEWGSAKDSFNQWIDNWRTLFKEINKTTNVKCVEYFRSLEMIG